MTVIRSDPSPGRGDQRFHVPLDLHHTRAYALGDEVGGVHRTQSISDELVSGARSLGRAEGEPQWGGIRIALPGGVDRIDATGAAVYLGLLRHSVAHGEGDAPGGEDVDVRELADRVDDLLDVDVRATLTSRDRDHDNRLGPRRI